jgi:hypothetical protein
MSATPFDDPFAPKNFQPRAQPF